MIVTIYNRKYNDEICYVVDELDEETRQEILEEVHSKGWQDEDCWSEVIY